MKVGVNNCNIAWWSDGFMMKDLVKNAQRGRGGGLEYSPYESDYTDASGWPTAFQDGREDLAWIVLRLRDLDGNDNPGMASSVYPSGVYNVYYEGPVSALCISYQVGNSEERFRTNQSLASGRRVTVVTEYDPGVTVGHAQYTLSQEYASGYDEITLKFLYTEDEIPTDYLRNVRIIHEDYSNYDDEPFTPTYINLVKRLTSPDGMVRPMQTLETNGATFDRNADPTGPGGSRRSSFDTSSENAFSGLTKPYHMQGASGGCSFEYAIRLANQADRDLHLPIYHDVSDKTVSSIAQLVLDELDPNHKVYVELGNEIWNPVLSYSVGYLYYNSQTSAADVSDLYNDPLTGDRGSERKRTAIRYAQRAVEVFKIFEDIFGGTDRLDRVLAWQTGAYTDASAMLYASGHYSSVDSFSIAPYVGGNLSGFPATRDNASGLIPNIYNDQWDTAELFKQMRATFSASLDVTQPLNDDEEVAVNKKNISRVKESLASRSEFDHIKLNAYEAGQHINISTNLLQSPSTLNDFGDPLSVSDAAAYTSGLYLSAQYDSLSNGEASAFSKYYLDQMEASGFDATVLFVDVGFWQADIDAGVQFFGFAEDAEPSTNDDKVLGVESFISLSAGNIALGTLSLGLSVDSSFDGGTSPVTVTVPQIGYRISNNRQ
jgi:hypothetical protein